MLPENFQKAFKESADKLWLAGLGALSLVEEKGNEFLERLVEKGKSHKLRDSNPVHLTSETLESMRRSAESYRHSVENFLQNRAKEVMDQLGLASRNEIENISGRLDTLSKILGNMKEKRRTDTESTGEKH
jgi:poly(hydroxyalkanoate) granule-associated protein